MTHPGPPSPQEPAAPDESSAQSEVLDSFAAEPPADEPPQAAPAGEPDDGAGLAGGDATDASPPPVAPAVEPAPADRTLPDEEPAAPADAVTPPDAPAPPPQEEPTAEPDSAGDAPPPDTAAPASATAQPEPEPEPTVDEAGPADVGPSTAGTDSSSTGPDAGAPAAAPLGEQAPAEHTLLDEQTSTAGATAADQDVEPLTSQPDVAFPGAPDAPVDVTEQQPSDAPAPPPVDDALVPSVAEPVAPVDVTEQQRSAAAVGRRGGAWIPVTAVAVTVALLAAAAGFLGWRVRQQAEAEQAREEAVAAARDAARLLFSYNHESLEQDFEKGVATTTGEFREQYGRTTKEVVTPVAERYDAVVVAEVVEAAVVSASADEVTALVFLNQATTSTRVQGQQVDQSRVRMRLVERNGRWLVEAVEAL